MFPEKYNRFAPAMPHADSKRAAPHGRAANIRPSKMADAESFSLMATLRDQLFLGASAHTCSTTRSGTEEVKFSNIISLSKFARSIYFAENLRIIRFPDARLRLSRPCTQKFLVAVRSQNGCRSACAALELVPRDFTKFYPEFFQPKIGGIFAGSHLAGASMTLQLGG